MIEPETAEFAPTPALQPGPPADEPVAAPALAEGTSVASAEEAAAKPTSGDLAPSPPANKGFFRRLVDGLVSDEAGTEADTPSDTAPSPAAPSVSDAPPEASEPPPVPVPTADDGLAGPAVPPADFPPLPVIEPETAEFAPTPALQPGPPADEPVAAPALAEGTSVASAEEAAAEPTSGDLAPPPPANKGFFRRLIDSLGSGEAESEVDTPSDAAPSPAAPSVSDAAPEVSEPPADGIAAPATPHVDFEPLPAIDPEIAAIPPAAELPPEPPADRPAPVPVLAEAPPVASAEEATPHVDFEPLPAIDPEIAAIPPAPESPLEPPADGPAPVPVLAEAPPVASAEEAAAEPTPVNRGFFRRLIDRLGSGEAGSEADTPSDPAPSPATPPVSDAGPETSEPPPAPAAVDLRALPMIKPETAAIPPAPALQTGSPDDPVSPPVRAEGPLENTSTPRLTVRASPNSESARPSEPAEIVSATDPFDPNEAPRGAELPIVGAIIGPGTTAEAVPPPPIAPPVPTTEEASAPPSAPVEEPADTASAATEVAAAAAGTETAAEPTIDAATPATLRASAPAKESSEEITRPGPLGRIYQAVEDLFGASAETEKRPEPRQATVETARLSEEPLEETVAEPRPPPERYLKGVTLAIADALALGARKFPQTPVAHAPENCVRKQRGTILFCVEPVTWPGDIEEHFAVSTFFYRGMNAIVRYEEGESRYIYALFATDGFEAVSAYFRARYGPPTSTVRRRVTLMATPRMTSPAMIWRSADETSGAVTTLEVRKYDDSRGGFADVRHGAITIAARGNRADLSPALDLRVDGPQVRADQYRPKNALSASISSRLGGEAWTRAAKGSWRTALSLPRYPSARVAGRSTGRARRGTWARNRRASARCPAASSHSSDTKSASPGTGGPRRTASKSSVPWRPETTGRWTRALAA